MLFQLKGGTTMRRITLIPLLALILTIGCTKNPVSAPIPGSANAFDSSSYLTLVTTDSVIQSTKVDLTAGNFSASVAPTVKSALNILIQAYDVANTAYLAYHTAALANTATPAQQQAVASNLSTMEAATSNLTVAKGGK